MPEMHDAPARKAALRRTFTAYREALPPEEQQARSRSIIRRAAELPELAAARTVHAYWPATGRGEVDTRPLIAALAAEGKRVVLPRVVLPAPGASSAPAMQHVRYRKRDGLAPNRWGILEPTGDELVDPREVDVVVVPALGAGRNGHRIGYGGGFYDAFLAPIDAATVCLVFEACLLDRVPQEAHDVPLRALVTETEVVRPGL